MINKKIFLFASVLSLFIFSCQDLVDKQEASAQKKYTLWYEKPASHFEESLVLGNGKMGASIFGGVQVDSIYLNDATLWSGEPVNPNMNPNAHEYIDDVRKVLEDEEYQKADELIKNIQGSYSQSFAPLGTLFFEYDHDEHKSENYRRSLNISDATSEVSYQIDGVNYVREYFISHPDNVMVINLKSDALGKLNFTADFSSLLKFTTTVNEPIQKTDGYAPYRCEPNYSSNIENPVRFDDCRGIHFSNYVKINNTDGKVSFEGSKLILSEGSFAQILVSVATSFNGFDKDPVKEGKPYKEIAQRQLDNASKKAYKQLLSDHLDDHHALFNRLTFQLQEIDTLNLPTNKRLIRYSKGKQDKGLEELYFHFGRYLLIASSRTPGVPANLQGIWNPYLRPPWSSNYTTNINVEENYWLAEVANLSECHFPLLSWIENLEETGKITAPTFYGARGWTVGHNSDIWAMSNPVGDFGNGHPVWANWNMGGAWLSTHLWEHYLYNQNLDFLKQKAYPLMKGAALFCIDMMVKDKKGNWVTSPSTSPENMYVTSTGYRGATLYGATSDLAIVREVFNNTIRAAEILDTDLAFQNELKERLNELHPYQISKKGGHLLEWYHDWDDDDPQHRHQSHLFGLYPGHHISPERTPELAEAAKKTLNIKGDKSTGWSQGWRINLWARLKDGKRAYKLYRELLNYVDPTGLEANNSNAGGTYPNLFDAHPPFQIDGNFGGAAGVMEMIVQSTEKSIHLLPAIPDTWQKGKLHGVKARGGFELTFSWENKKVTNLTIFSKNGGKTIVHCNGETYEVSLKENQTIQIIA
ncbi:alpha-L-fucosidase 2 [Maribacter caenipelagi]|uniref:Alpha-L-fucosidase 2 n=1 Tax=Maribacter caenipelagi TaxID=1447781 RepID=A0A4R7DEJ5_9FLAO|nr:glycoside hydrolase family 95 protein [Maribacter caenipelagi]TDS18755.1 alpha-L-fucosidase 2 [Maribacter caenipelagi]